MPRTKRKDVLKAIRLAGYHGDKELATRLYVKNWVSLEAFAREFDIGAAMRESGMPCDCFECGKADRDAALPEDWPARKAQPSGKSKTMAMVGALPRAAVRVAMRKAPSLRG
jgi:hypothetical protein